MQKQESQFLVDLWSSEAFPEVLKLISFGSTDDSKACTPNIGPCLWEPLESVHFFDTVSLVEPIPTEEAVIEAIPDPTIRKKRNASNGKMTAKNMYHQLNKQNDPHLLVSPYFYGEEIGPCPESEQPYSIVVHPQVGLLCDLHGHLCDAEVIGLLAGRWDASTKTLFIQAAFPCTSTERREDDGFTDVELDSEAEFKVRSAVESLGMVVVGWYHSHPLFRPDPSVTDIANQFQYQALMKDATTGCEPFVGLIVSTYDKELTSEASRHQWFCVTPYSDPASGFTRPVQLPMVLSVQYKSVLYDFASSGTEERAIQFDELLFGFNVKLPDPPVCLECDKTAKFKEDSGDDNSDDEEDDDSDFKSSSSRGKKKGPKKGGGKGGRKGGAGIGGKKNKKSSGKGSSTAATSEVGSVKSGTSGGRGRGGKRGTKKVEIVPLTGEEVEELVDEGEKIVANLSAAEPVKRRGRASAKKSTNDENVAAVDAAVVADPDVAGDASPGQKKAGVRRKAPSRKKSSASIEEKLEHVALEEEVVKADKSGTCADATAEEGSGEYAVGESVAMEESCDEPSGKQQPPTMEPSRESDFESPFKSEEQSGHSSTTPSTPGEGRRKESNESLPAIDDYVPKTEVVVSLPSECSTDVVKVEKEGQSEVAVASAVEVSSSEVKVEPRVDSDDAAELPVGAHQTIETSTESLTASEIPPTNSVVTEEEILASFDEAAVKIIADSGKKRGTGKKVTAVVIPPRISMRAIEKKSKQECEQLLLASSSSEMQVEPSVAVEPHPLPGKRRKRAESHASEASVEASLPKRRYTRRSTGAASSSEVAAGTEPSVSTRAKPAKALPAGDPRLISILLSLQDKEYDSTETARRMLRVVAPAWKFLVLMIISLSLYYSRRSPRIDLSKKWKLLGSKFEKIRASAKPWAIMLGLCSELDGSFLDWIKMLLELVWKDYAKCITKVGRVRDLYQ